MNNNLLRIIICGSREFNNFQLFSSHCSDIISRLQYINEIGTEDVEIISGGARGVDTMAMEFALLNRITAEHRKEFFAEWDDPDERPASWKKKLHSSEVTRETLKVKRYLISESFDYPSGVVVELKNDFFVIDSGLETLVEVSYEDLGLFSEGYNVLAGFNRNTRMIEYVRKSGGGYMIAFLKKGAKSKGTKDSIKKAGVAGLDVIKVSV